MGNILKGFKKIFGNKNVLTILLVAVAIVALWIGYNYRVQHALTLVKIPCASTKIEATSVIKEDDIKCTVEVTQEFAKTTGVITSKANLIGRYVTTSVTIPENGLFFSSQVVDKSQLNNTIFDDIEDGYTAYNLKVDNHITYGNSIYPGDRIDIYMKATDDDNKVIYGKLVSSIPVLAVFDGSGHDAFSSGSDPAELIFSVDNDMYELLKKTDYISGIELVPVPRNKKYSTSGTTETMQVLQNFILTKSSSLGSN